MKSAGSEVNKEATIEFTDYSGAIFHTNIYGYELCDKLSSYITTNFDNPDKMKNIKDRNEIEDNFVSIFKKYLSANSQSSDISLDISKVSSLSDIRSTVTEWKEKVQKSKKAINMDGVINLIDSYNVNVIEDYIETNIKQFKSLVKFINNILDFIDKQEFDMQENKGVDIFYNILTDLGLTLINLNKVILEFKINAIKEQTNLYKFINENSQ